MVLAHLLNRRPDLLISPLDAVLGASSSVLCVTLLLLWRLTDGARWVTHAIVAGLTVQFTTAVFAGAAEYVAWFGLISIVAFMLLGQRTGAVWSAVLLVLMVLMVWLDVGETVNVAHDTAEARLLRVVTLVPTLTMVGALFEHQRRETTSRLELALAARDRLLAHVSHEMRTPLNGIIGTTQERRAAPLPPELASRLTTIAHSSEALLTLITDLLDFARAEPMAFEYQVQPFELGPLLERTVELHRARAQAFGVELKLERPPGPVPVLGDPTRLQQVVSTMLAHGIRRSSEAPVTLRLQTELRGAKVRARLCVSDLGPALEGDELRELFQPLSWLDGDGEGLGLYLSRNVARALGGELQLEPHDGPGARLVFTVSLGQVVATAPRPDGLRGSVLVVDDNPINLKVASALLRKLGLDVSTAPGGREALAAAAATPFDFVLMDLQMPELDGFETSRQLRATGFKGPIVALTASAEPETERQCLDAGMQVCLVKPLRLEQLTPVVTRLLEAGDAGVTGRRRSGSTPLPRPA